jgi:hypothetical protein
VSYLQYIYDHDLCIRKRETVSYPQYVYFLFCVSERGKLSYLQYVYVLDFVYQKEGNCIIPIICLCSRFCGSERRKLSYLQYVYDHDCVYRKEGNCIIPTICSGFSLVFEVEGGCKIIEGQGYWDRLGAQRG